MPTRSIPWPRILAEGVAIVVSILLAFGIQAWWEGRQERRQETEYLTALSEEVGLGLARLPGAEGTISGILHAHESLLDQFGADSLAPSDSLIYWLAELSRPASFSPPRAVLDDLVSSGGIQLIKTDSLRLLVARYEDALLRLEQNSDRAWATWAERIQPHLEGRVPRVERLRRGSYESNVGVPLGESPFTPDYEAVFSDPAFESMVAERWMRINSLVGGLNGVRSLMNEMVAMIDQAFAR